MLPAGTFNTTYAKDMAIIRTRLQWILFVSFLIFLFVGFPQWASRGTLTLANNIAITLIAVLGLNILTGMCGQISLGQAAFMGVGAYVQGVLVTTFGFNFLIALPISATATALVGLLFGIPSLRNKGFYLAMATLAAQFIIVWAIQHSPRDLTGGVNGLHVAKATLGPWEFDEEESFFYLAFSVAAVMTLFAKNIARTRVGRAFIAIRDNDLAAEAMGINLFQYKLLAFAISSFFAGVAGALLSHHLTVISPDYFMLVDSVWQLGMLIVGGLGSVLGAILGTITLMVLRDLVVPVLAPALAKMFPMFQMDLFTSLALMIFGVVLIVFLIFEPRGLAHRWEIFKASYRLHPFSY